MPEPYGFGLCGGEADSRADVPGWQRKLGRDGHRPGPCLTDGGHWCAGRLSSHMYIKHSEEGAFAGGEQHRRWEPLYPENSQRASSSASPHPELNPTGDFEPCEHSRIYLLSRPKHETIV